MDEIIVCIILLVMSGFSFAVGVVATFLVMKFGLLEKLGRKNPPRNTPPQMAINPYQNYNPAVVEKTGVYSEDYMEGAL